MSRKKSLDELKAARAALDEQIAEMQKEQLAAVARWVLRQTSCSSLAELKAAGWSLAKKPPADGAAGGDEMDAKDEKDETATGDGAQNVQAETEIKAFNPSSVWNG